jgi:hypothetical protein
MPLARKGGFPMLRLFALPAREEFGRDPSVPSGSADGIALLRDQSHGVSLELGCVLSSCHFHRTPPDGYLPFSRCPFQLDHFRVEAPPAECRC